MAITYGGKIKEAPAGMLTNFQPGVFSISVVDRNNQMREWPLDYGKLTGIFVYNGDVVRVNQPFVTVGAVNVNVFDIHAVFNGSFGISQTIGFNGTNQKNIKVSLAITGDSNNSAIVATVARSQDSDPL